jgi:hypothetical protein
VVDSDIQLTYKITIVKTKKEIAVAKKPTKKIIAFRLPGDVMKTLGAKAAKQHVSRNKFVEIILRQYLAKTDRELAELITNLVEAPDDRQVDLFA